MLRLRGQQERVGRLQVEVNQYVIFSMFSRMILYGVTVYNAILIISYRIITYKLIYITVPEDHPGAYNMVWPQAQGSPAAFGRTRAGENPALVQGSYRVGVQGEVAE